MMEVIAVSSAIYGLLLSMVICITAVAVFTGHILLLAIVFATIFGKHGTDRAQISIEPHGNTPDLITSAHVA